MYSRWVVLQCGFPSIKQMAERTRVSRFWSYACTRVYHNSLLAVWHPICPFIPSTIIRSLILYVEIKWPQNWIPKWHPNATSIIAPEPSSFPLILLIYVQHNVIQQIDLCILVNTVNDLPTVYSRCFSHQCSQQANGDERIVNKLCWRIC